MPLSILEIFNKIQLKVFNEIILDLKFCSDCHSFYASYGDKAVYMPQEQIYEIFSNHFYSEPESVLTFILAHEISHFLQNSYGHRHNNHSISDHLYLASADSRQTMFISSFVQIQSISINLHAEVDHYALVLIESMPELKVNKPDILQWFIETSYLVARDLDPTSDFSTLTDLNFRRIQLEKTMRTIDEYTTARSEF